MKITNLEAIPVSVPFTHGGPATGFGGVDWTELTFLLVKVQTDQGVTGYGEAFGYNVIPATKVALETLIKPQVIGRDPREIGPLMDELALKLHIFGRYGVTMFALSGLDIALWDIAGKIAGVPLATLLGGIERTQIPTYASLLKYADDDVVARLTGEAIDKGYGSIKLHENTVSPVVAAREAAGPNVPIMLDVNCVWSPKQAADMANALEPCNLHWLEEPIWPPENFRALADLRRSSSVRIASGENACTSWQFREMLAVGAVDYAQPSVTKVGGVSEFRKITALAETENVTLAPHSPYFGPGLLATLHLIAATKSIESIERFYVEFEETMYGDALDPVDGIMSLPTGPGLGLDPDPYFLAKYGV